VSGVRTITSKNVLLFCMREGRWTLHGLLPHCELRRGTERMGVWGNAVRAADRNGDIRLNDDRSWSLNAEGPELREMNHVASR
jgi:hypothetical protein